MLAKWSRVTSSVISYGATSYISENSVMRTFGIFPQIHNSSPVMRKHWANPNWEIFYKIHEQLLQKKDENCHRLKETRNMTVKCNKLSGIRSWNRRGTLWENWWNPNKVHGLIIVLYQCSFHSFNKCTIVT